MKTIKNLWAIVGKDDTGKEFTVKVCETRDEVRKWHLPNHRKIIKFERFLKENKSR